MSEILLPMLSSRISMILSLTFKPLIHFEFIFVYGIRRRSNFIFCMYLSNFLNTTYFFKRFYLFLGREKERERNIDVWLPLTHPLLGSWPATQACALTGNRTSDPLVHVPALNPLSHTSQGSASVIE